MHYKQLLKTEYIDTYKQYHRTIFLDMQKIVFDLEFIKALYGLYELGINYHIINHNVVVLPLYLNQINLLAIRIYKTLFDSGTNVISLNNFKTYTLKNVLDTSAKDYILNRVRTCAWEDRTNKKNRERIKEIVRTFRNGIFAHSLDFPIPDTLNIADMEQSFNESVSLFMALSFEADDIYTAKEKYGYDFSKLDSSFFNAERNSVNSFIAPFVSSNLINSSYISNLDIKFVDSIPDEVRDKINMEIEKVKKEHSIND
jgi:hypothetical protein